ERAGEELAFGVVLRALHQALADALHHAAVDLALDQQRIHDEPEVVHRAVAHHLDLAGVRIDLDLRHVAAVRERRWNDFGDVADIQLSGKFFYKVEQTNRAIGARHDEPP